MVLQLVQGRLLLYTRRAKARCRGRKEHASGMTPAWASNKRRWRAPPRSSRDQPSTRRVPTARDEPNRPQRTRPQHVGERRAISAWTLGVDGVLQRWPTGPEARRRGPLRDPRPPPNERRPGRPSAAHGMGAGFDGDTPARALRSELRSARCRAQLSFLTSETMADRLRARGLGG